MKHKLLLSAICLLMASFSSLFATDFTVDGINYSILSDGTVCVTQSYDVSGDVTIPAKVTNIDICYLVTEIGELAFYNCTGLTSITIPNSVTSIEKYAFYGCM